MNCITKSSDYKYTLLFLGLVFYLFNSFSQTTTTIIASADADIRSTSSTNYGLCDNIWVGSSDNWRGLVYFDLSSIPSNATITNAFITLTAIDGSSNGNRNVHVHRVTSEWTEGNSCGGSGPVNWYNRLIGLNWNTSGGDFTPSITSTIVSGTYFAPYNWTITQTVQDWINGAYPNFGVIFIQTENQYKAYATKDHATSNYHPRLTITYNLPPTAPGGVTQNMAFWVKADAGTLLNANKVTQWQDQSSSNRHLLQNTDARRPTWNANGQNFNPTVQFNANLTQFFSRNPNFNVFSSSYSIYLVGYSTDGQRVFLTVDAPSPSLNSGIHIEGNGDQMRFLHRNPPQMTGGDNLIAGIFSNATNNIFSFYRNANTKHKFFTNGIPSILSTITQSGFTLGQVTDLTVGQLGDQNLRYLNGDIAEIVIYTQDNESQRLRVESYLALKYGISINDGVGSNYVASNGSTVFWDATDNNNFNNDVVGIGRDDNSALTQKQSRSSHGDPFFSIYLLNSINDPLPATNTLNTNLFSQDLSFLMFGNNNGSISTWFYSLPKPKKIVARVERIWKIQKTNAINDVILVINESDLPINTGLLPLFMLVSNTSDMTDATFLPMTKVGTTWRILYNFSSNSFISFAYGVNERPMRHGKSVINGERVPYK